MFKQGWRVFLGLSLVITVCVIDSIAGFNGHSGRAISESLEHVSLTGSVGDGPIVEATISVISARGVLLGTELSDNTASYKTKIRTRRTDFPLTLVTSGGIDLVTGYEPNFRLFATAFGRSDKRRANLNPFSTLITKTTAAMPGGVTQENLSEIKGIVSRHLSFGLDPIMVPDPMTSKVTGENIADIVKSGEVLAEAIRRTRKALIVVGVDLSEDQIIDTLARDLTDTVIDGRGAIGVDALIAATMNIVSAQVLVEALTNHLKVDDVQAAPAMDAAIVMTKSAAIWMTGDVLITEEMLLQTQTAVAATQVIEPSAELSNLAAALQGLPTDTLAGRIVPLLPGEASQFFDQAILYIVTATVEELEAVNAVVRSRVREGAKAPMVMLTANSSQVEYQGMLKLNWSSTDADSCTALGAWAGSKTLSGSEMVGPLTIDSGFILSCTGSAGEASAAVVVEVRPPPAPLITLSANPVSIAYSGTVTLNWSSANTDSCNASGAWSGSKGEVGSEIIGSLTKDSSFTLNCSGPGGEASITVLVSVQPAPMPTLMLSADTVSVAYNGLVTLDWMSKDADLCAAFGDWSGFKVLSGSETIGPLTSNSNFVMRCTGVGGEANAAVVVDVQLPPPPEVMLTADASSVAFNSTVLLSWSSTNASSCAASGDWSGNKEVTGSESVGPVTGTVILV